MSLKPETIAQYVIDNRHTPFTGERMTDFELYHTLLDKINELLEGYHKTECNISFANEIKSNVYIRNLLATSKNLIGVIKNNQFKRLNSKVWELENAVELIEKFKALQNKTD